MKRLYSLFLLLTCSVLVYADPSFSLPDSSRGVTEIQSASNNFAAFVIDVLSALVVAGGLIYVAVQGIKWQWGDKEEATENLKQFAVGTGLYMFSGTIVMQIFKIFMG